MFLTEGQELEDHEKALATLIPAHNFDCRVFGVRLSHDTNLFFKCYNKDLKIIWLVLYGIQSRWVGWGQRCTLGSGEAGELTALKSWEEKTK